MKPNNILLDEKLHAKIADLGISRILENRLFTKNMTVSMTPVYAPPELLINNISSYA